MVRSDTAVAEGELGASVVAMAFADWTEALANYLPIVKVEVWPAV